MGTIVPVTLFILVVDVLEVFPEIHEYIFISAAPINGGATSLQRTKTIQTVAKLIQNNKIKPKTT
jgi:hypothetical protein